jgi:hypothetical protein
MTISNEALANLAGVVCRRCPKEYQAIPSAYPLFSYAEQFDVFVTLISAAQVVASATMGMSDVGNIAASNIGSLAAATMIAGMSHPTGLYRLSIRFENCRIEVP